MKVEHITFQLPDGSSNALQLYPTTAHSRAVIMVFPAMGIKASYYSELGKQLAAQGFTTALCDLRGLGASSLRASRKVNFGYAEMLAYDYSLAFELIKERFTGQRIYFLGHSLGGQLGSLFASAHPQALAGLILVASCSVYYKGWQGIGRWRTLLGTQMMRAISAVLGYFPGKQLGFGGQEAEGVIADWSRQARTGVYEIGRERISYEEKLAALKLPVCSISFEADQLCPRQAAENLYRKFHPDAPVAHHHLMPDDPRNNNFNHFNWVKKPANVISMIDQWLTAQANG